MRLAALAAAFVFFAATADASEEEDLEQAKAAFEGGKTAYTAGNYEAAIAAFAQADRLAPRPAIVFSLAQAYRLQYFVDKQPPRLKRAVELYRRYLAEEPDGPRREDSVTHLAMLEPVLLQVEAEHGRAAMVEQSRSETQLMVSTSVKDARISIDGSEPVLAPVIRTVTPGPHQIKVTAAGYFGRELEKLAVEGRLVVIDAELEERPAQLALAVPDGSEVMIGGRLVGEAPLGGPIPLPAGRHFVSISKNGAYPMAEELVVERGQELQVKVDLDTTVQRTTAYVVLGTSGALLVGGAVTTLLAVLAEGSARDVRARLDAGENLLPADLDAYDRAVNRRDTFTTASVGLFAGGAAAALAGVLLYAFDHPRAESAPGFQVGPAAGPGGLGVSGRF